MSVYYVNKAEKETSINDAKDTSVILEPIRSESERIDKVKEVRQLKSKQQEQHIAAPRNQM